jgi:ferritin-like metal-binding protein YciE
MASEKKLNDLFKETLQDIYYAERAILKALPKMAKGAQSAELAAAFETHRNETENQVQRLEQVFQIMGERPRAKTCDAIIGIIDEGNGVMADYKGTLALDAGLVASAQAVEHYEIARYGTLKTWAGQLGLTDAVPLLDETLQEEIKTDQLLSSLGERDANRKAG